MRLNGGVPAFSICAALVAGSMTPQSLDAQWADPTVGMYAEAAAVGFGATLVFARSRGGLQSMSQGLRVWGTSSTAALLLASGFTEPGREGEVARSSAIWGAGFAIGVGVVSSAMTGVFDDWDRWDVLTSTLIGFAAGAVIGAAYEIRDGESDDPPGHTSIPIVLSIGIG